jgi:hypothetical protein
MPAVAQNFFVGKARRFFCSGFLNIRRHRDSLLLFNSFVL